ncbi:MAG: insulinase family protein [Rhizomicrobium sp.]
MKPEITRLSNGLTVVTDPMPQLQSAMLGVWVDAGSRNETRPLMGVSHMLEHMAFKGTATRSARDLAEEIEAVGGYLNAYTSREQTAFHARVLKADVPLGIDLLADILIKPDLRTGRTRTRAPCRPSGDRPGRRYARRHHLRPSAIGDLSGPADRLADPGLGRNRQRLHAGASAHLFECELPRRWHDLRRIRRREP